MFRPSHEWPKPQTTPRFFPLAQRNEAVVLVESQVRWLGRLQVAGAAIGIGPIQNRAHQCSADAVPPGRRIDAQQDQIPMRFRDFLAMNRFEMANETNQSVRGFAAHHRGERIEPAIEHDLRPHLLVFWRQPEGHAVNGFIGKYRATSKSVAKERHKYRRKPRRALLGIGEDMLVDGIFLECPRQHLCGGNHLGLWEGGDTYHNQGVAGDNAAFFTARAAAAAISGGSLMPGEGP